MEVETIMRVLLVAPYGGVPGGISRWTGHVLDYYEQSGHDDCELRLVSTGRSTFVNINSPLLYKVKSAIKDFRKIFKDFDQTIQQQPFDVMHLTSSASLSLLKDIRLLKKAKKKGIRTVIHFRFGRIPELSKSQNWEWKLLTKVIRLADVAIVIDEQSLKVLQDLHFTNVRYLANPISPQVLDIVSKIDVAREPRTLLFCGHVVKTKGVFELIDACAQISSIKLKMVGHVTQEMKAELEQYSNSASWLTIAGEEPYEEVIKEMLSCDVFVLATYTEGFPNVILESMACGCAIATTPVGAIPEMLDMASAEPCGLCCEPKDVEGLRHNIQYFLDHPDEARAYGHRAAQRVNDMYAMPKVWEQMVGIWREVC